MGRSSKLDGGAVALDRWIYPEGEARVPVRRVPMIRHSPPIGLLGVGGAAGCEPSSAGLRPGPLRILCAWYSPIARRVLPAWLIPHPPAALMPPAHIAARGILP